jgi:hypothetical protein
MEERCHHICQEQAANTIQTWVEPAPDPVRATPGSRENRHLQLITEEGKTLKNNGCSSWLLGESLRLILLLLFTINQKDSSSTFIIL